MSRKLIITLIFDVMLCYLTFGAEIHLKVETDKMGYHVGDTVSWTIYAWASQGDNRGVALISVDLDDDPNEILEEPLHDPNEFTDTYYGSDELFLLLGSGTPATEPPRLRDLFIMQIPDNRMLDVGNDGDPNHIFAKGEFVVTITGSHELNVSLNGANYWPDEINNAKKFEVQNMISSDFTVYYRADIDKDGSVNFTDLYFLCQ